MCLILLAYKCHPDYPLIVVANRDEHYSRPTAAASVWPESSGIIAGRDLQAQGTWLGVTASGRFAAVTNYRSSDSAVPTDTSRGDLVTGFLRSSHSASQYLSDLVCGSDFYQGFNLLVFDGTTLACAANHGSDRLQILAPGVHGLSNAQMNTAWPKVTNGKARLQTLINRPEFEIDDLVQLMLDRAVPQDRDLPETGVSLEMERLLSPAFIESETYGTRSTTAVMISNQGEVDFVERSHGGDDEERVTQRFHYSVNQETAPA
ncbi:MAG: NRDE family protein [Pseudomonadota bacterium]